MLSIKEQIRRLLWTLFTLHLLRVRHAGFNSAWCHSTWFSQFEYCSIYFAVGRAMIFHLQFPYGFMLFHDSTEIPFVRFKMAGGDCCGQFACLLWMRVGFRAAERELVFLCRSPFYLLHSCFQRSWIKSGRCVIQWMDRMSRQLRPREKPAAQQHGCALRLWAVS